MMLVNIKLYAYFFMINISRKFKTTSKKNWMTVLYSSPNKMCYQMLSSGANRWKFICKDNLYLKLKYSLQKFWLLTRVGSRRNWLPKIWISNDRKFFFTFPNKNVIWMESSKFNIELNVAFVKFAWDWIKFCEGKMFRTMTINCWI